MKNWSETYAEYALKRVSLLTNPPDVSEIEDEDESKDSDKSPPNPYPLSDIEGFINMETLMEPDALLKEEVWALEKLDGTNFAVRCDGVKFGRRKKVDSDKYQKVELGDQLPSIETILELKRTILGSVDFECVNEEGIKPQPMLMMYGELMCNKNVYGYGDRDMWRDFFAFGIVLDMSAFDRSQMEELTGKLLSVGYLAAMSDDKNQITIKPNDKFLDLLATSGIKHAPLLARGTLPVVCASLEEKMMDNDGIEGVVIFGNKILTKWKNGKESSPISAIMTAKVADDIDQDLLKKVGVDRELAGCLKRVVQNKPDLELFPDNELQTAFESALTKFDSLDEYFERGETNAIQKSLSEEMSNDPNLPSSKKKAVKTFVFVSLEKARLNWRLSNRQDKRLFIDIRVFFMMLLIRKII